MWDLPGPGLEPVSPALAGGFLTTAPPGKPWSPAFNAKPQADNHQLLWKYAALAIIRNVLLSSRKSQNVH